jgi:hypothetical protein
MKVNGKSTSRMCLRSGRALHSPRRPEWCPINIIRFEDVRKVLDAKEKNEEKE